MATPNNTRMFLSTAAKVVIVATVLLLVMACMLRTTSHVTDLNIQHMADRHLEQFSNPTQPPIPDVSARDLARYEHDHRKDVEGIYDRYYANLYGIIFDQHKHKLMDFECYDFQHRARLGEYGRRAVILDIGCGTGEHLKCLAKDNPKAKLYGLDISKPMLDRAQRKLSKYQDRTRFIQGDINDPDAVFGGLCTHITCFYFGFYYSDSPQLFFENCYRWLKRGGHLCVHLVHPSKFNPVPHVANPIRGISLQNYLDKRKTDCKVYFNNFVYHSDFHIDHANNRATLSEKFIYPKKQYIREHTHQLHMYHYETIIRTARKCGFRLRHITKLFEIGQDNEYLCYLQKQ